MMMFLCFVPVFLLDFLAYLLSFEWFNKLFLQNNKRSNSTPSSMMQSVAVGDATESHGAPRRSVSHPDSLVQGTVGTIYEMTQNAVAEFSSSHVAMATQKFVELKKIHPTDRFPSKVFDNSCIEEITYEQFGEQLLDFGAGLRKLGMEPIPKHGSDSNSSFDALKGPFVMVIFEDTCKQWTTAMQGAFSQSITVATCYATLGADAVISAVNQTGACTLLLNWKHVDKFIKMADQMPSLKTIIASTHEMPENTPMPQGNNTIQVVSSDEVLTLGHQQRKEFPPVPPRPSDVAVIMYTSGSTGAPKGVVMKHSQLVAGVSGMAMKLDIRRGEEVFVSYLPLAHILALQVENGVLSYGAKICYSDPRQLGTTLALFKPTVFAGVPKVWDTLKSRIEKKLEAKPPVKFIFDSLMQWKRLALRMGLDTPVSNVFFKVVTKQVFGGLPRYGVSGGGPLNANLQEFCRACFCCPIVQGYALTETCVGGCFQNLDDPRYSVIGAPAPCVEIMLQSEPDIKDGAGMPYLHTDTISSKGDPVIGRGEVCMRGPSISSGYYKLPDKTKEEYDEDGWFHTGDIGQFTSDGVLQIVDRKKNLVKLRGGEYVAVESMENAFGQSPFVLAVCVVANGDLDTPLAIVNTDNENLEKWASKNTNASSPSAENLAEDPSTRKAVVESMVSAGKEAGLTPLELRVKDCCLIVSQEWGPGNGMTASMKLDRRAILSMHQDALNAMLQRNGVHPE